MSTSGAVARPAYRIRGGSVVADKASLQAVQRVVAAHLASTPYTAAAVDAACEEFFITLGLPSYYFDSTPADVIAKHISSLLAAKELAKSSGHKQDIQLNQESDTRAFFAARSTISMDLTGAAVRKGNASLSPVAAIERYIDARYLGGGENTRASDEVKAFPVASEKGIYSLSQAPATSLATAEQPWRLQCYRSRGVLEDGSHLRLYFLQQPDFVNPSPAPGETRLEELADRTFLARTTPELRDAYAKLVEEASKRMGPAIHVQTIKDIAEEEDAAVGIAEEGAEEDGVLLMVGHRAGSTHSLFSGLPDIYRWQGYYAMSKFVEVFSNGVVVFTFRLRNLDSASANLQATPAPTGFSMRSAGASMPPVNLDGSTAAPLSVNTGRNRRLARLTGPQAPTTEERMRDMQRDASLHFTLPRTSLTPLLHQGVLSAQEVAYAYCAWKYSYHFLPRMSDEFNTLLAMMKKHADGGLGADMNTAQALLSKVRKSVQAHNFTESQILDTIFQFPEVIAWLYEDFALRHKPSSVGGCASPAAVLPSHEDLLGQLRKMVKTNEEDVAILTAFLTFNSAVLKTNFYVEPKTGLAFRLNPELILSGDYPQRPFGVFMMVFAEGRGFHVRFADVARGGIRLVKSGSPQAYAANLSGLFDEVYALSNTQQRKNKDIPEGGSKGVVLLNLAHQDKASIAFKKYIDCMLDLLLLPHPQVCDKYGKPEILFCGPDENTSELMDWACEHARERGYAFWKAFTTGKSVSLGGIPHDVFGMTTRGVRAFEIGVQRKLGLQPAQLFKMQTGGPDGDLGSNEILHSLAAGERIIAIVDGSGVLADLDGLATDELRRLAESRLMVKHFNRALLGARGFLVLVDETDVKLPNGVVVPSGLAFRNNAHLNPAFAGDFFVPCGGRPNAVQVENVEAFLYGAVADGSSATALPAPTEPGAAPRQPRFKYVCEGANVFFTQDARLAMEARGIVVFKDASANKGGVTSSSLEVMAALALTDAEFTKHMCCADAKPDSAEAPAFYREYVKEVQAIIEENAALEFECLWQEKERSGKPLSKLSDDLSNRITDLSARLEGSASLWANTTLRASIMRAAVPRTLANLVGGVDVILSRLPENYQRALFGSRLASRFIYSSGLNTSEYTFYEYVDTLLHSA